jgi:hypothetical protein
MVEHEARIEPKVKIACIGYLPHINDTKNYDFAEDARRSREPISDSTAVPLLKNRYRTLPDVDCFLQVPQCGAD